MKLAPSDACPARNEPTQADLKASAVSAPVHVAGLSLLEAPRQLQASDEHVLTVVAVAHQCDTSRIRRAFTPRLNTWEAHINPRAMDMTGASRCCDAIAPRYRVLSIGLGAPVNPSQAPGPQNKEDRKNEKKRIEEKRAESPGLLLYGEPTLARTLSPTLPNYQPQ